MLLCIFSNGALCIGVPKLVCMQLMIIVIYHSLYMYTNDSACILTYNLKLSLLPIWPYPTHTERVLLKTTPFYPVVTSDNSMSFALLHSWRPAYFSTFSYDIGQSARLLGYIFYRRFMLPQMEHRYCSVNQRYPSTTS